MYELKERFQELEQLPAPDLQQVIRVRVQRLQQPDALVSVAEQAWRRSQRRRVAALITQVVAAAAIVALGVGLALIFHYARTVGPVKHTPPFDIKSPGVGVCNRSCGVGQVLFVSASVGWLAENRTPDTPCNPLCPTTFVVFRTDDGGTHWMAQLTSQGRIQTILASPDGSEVLVVPQPYAGGPLFHSKDGGAHWTSFDLPSGAGQAVQTMCQVGPCRQQKIVGQVYFRNPREGWVLSQEKTFRVADLFHTTDGGAHWSLTRLDVKLVFNLDVVKGLTDKFGSVDHSLLGQLVFGDSSTGWFLPQMGSDMYATRDGGRTWRTQPLPRPIANQPDQPPANIESGRLFSDGNHGVLVFLVEGLYAYTTSDAGQHWSSPIRLPDGAGAAELPNGGGPFAFSGKIDFIDVTHWVASPQVTGAEGPTVGVGLMRTSDAGQHWEVLPYASLQHYGGWLEFLDPSDGWAFVTVSSGISLYRTSDGGLHWTPLSLPELR